MRRAFPLQLLAAMVAAGASARGVAAESLRCTVVADDFAPRLARVVLLDDKVLRCVDDKAQETFEVPLDRLVRLEGFTATEVRPRNPAAAATNFHVMLRDGQRWEGLPGKLDGDNLAWVNPGMGFTEAKPKSIPLKSIAAIASVAGSAPAELDRLASRQASATPQDELVLTNGDVISGVVSASDPQRVTCSTSDGQTVAVDWANLRTLKLAAVGAKDAAAPRPAPYRMTLRNGLVIDGVRCTADENEAAFYTVDGGRLSLGGGQGIVAIEHRGGRVHMLADMTPTSSTQAAYFPSKSEATNAAIAPPLVISGRTLRSTLFARPRSTTTYALDGAMKTFAVRYAISEGRPMADVTVRVKLDDKVVHEQAHVKSGPPSELLKLPLGAAKSLTLEVDYGDTYDVQDDFYWIEPALLSE